MEHSKTVFLLIAAFCSAQAHGSPTEQRYVGNKNAVVAYLQTTADRDPSVHFAYCPQGLRSADSTLHSCQPVHAAGVSQSELERFKPSAQPQLSFLKQLWQDPIYGPMLEAAAWYGGWVALNTLLIRTHMTNLLAANNILGGAMVAVLIAKNALRLFYELKNSSASTDAQTHESFITEKAMISDATLQESAQHLSLYLKAQ